jgi:hypothetical protein
VKKDSTSSEFIGLLLKTVGERAFAQSPMWEVNSQHILNHLKRSEPRQRMMWFEDRMFL